MSAPSATGALSTVTRNVRGHGIRFEPSKGRVNAQYWFWVVGTDAQEKKWKSAVVLADRLSRSETSGCDSPASRG